MELFLFLLKAAGVFYILIGVCELDVYCRFWWKIKKHDKLKFAGSSLLCLLTWWHKSWLEEMNDHTAKRLKSIEDRILDSLNNEFKLDSDQTLILEKIVHTLVHSKLSADTSDELLTNIITLSNIPQTEEEHQ